MFVHTTPSTVRGMVIWIATAVFLTTTTVVQHTTTALTVQPTVTALTARRTTIATTIVAPPTTMATAQLTTILTATVNTTRQANNVSMQCTNAISFCELLHVFSDDVSQNEKLIGNVCKVAELTDVDRLYIGSNFCGRYFVKFTESAVKKVVALTDSETFCNLKITLCVPIFSQSVLSDGVSVVARLLQQYQAVIDEVSVNDYAMLDYISKNFDVKINVGRMLCKDTRDQRHDEYFNVSHVPATDTLTSSVLSQYNVFCYDADLTNRFIDVSGSTLNYAFYYPYCFATVGNICEFAGIDFAIEKKFRANSPCAFSCTHVSIDYENSFGDKYLKLGRAVYFSVSDFSVNAQKPCRMVYEPFDMFKPGEQKSE